MADTATPPAGGRSGPGAEPTAGPDAGPGTGESATAGTPVPTRRGAPRPTLRPALVIVAIAVGLVLLFGIGTALSTGGSSSSSPPSPPASRPVGGTGLVAIPATQALRPILSPGVPPADIFGTLVVPRGSVRVGANPNKTSTSQYDRSVDLRAAASQGALVAFYQRELRHDGWRVLSTSGTSAHAVVVLAQRGGSDGWYWEAGVTVSPTSFGAPAKGGPPASGSTAANESTRFSLELLQQADDF